MATNTKVGHLDPTTWAQQVQLAADGKMDELKELQDKLNASKEV
jgi:large subunit ribosomal protein L21